MNRRKFLRNTILAAIGLGIGGIWGWDKFLSKRVDAITGKLSVRNIRHLPTENNGTKRHICWETEEPMTNPQMECAGVKYACEDISFCDEKKVYQYMATLTDLAPKSDYSYRIADEGKVTEWFSFKTDAKGDFSFLVFPDSQSSDYRLWQKIAGEAWSRNRGAELFVNLGDLVDNGQQNFQWNEWFDAVKEMSSSLLFVPVMGNHECYDLAWQTREPIAYTHYFPLPYYYSFDYGDVHFVSLSTCGRELGEELMSRQEEWLEKDLASCKGKWKIVFMHRDVLQYSSNKFPNREGFSEEGIRFMPIFDRHHVHLVFTAHLHTYRNHGHIKNFQKSEDGPLYILTGIAGNCFYDNLWKVHPLDDSMSPQPDRGNYLAAAVTENMLTVNTYLADGTLLETMTIVRSTAHENNEGG